MFSRYLDDLACGIISLAQIFDPDAIVLAGGITQQKDRLLRPLQKKVGDLVCVKISSLQNDAGALGAAML